MFHALHSLPSRISCAFLITAGSREILRSSHLSFDRKSPCVSTLSETRMTKAGVIELQQPLDYTDGASGGSEAAKEETSHHHGNEHDQADMARLGKEQRLRVRGNARWDEIRFYPTNLSL
jgi:hypothetical protein